MRKLVLRIRESMWLRPVIYSVLAFILALIVIYIDHNELAHGIVPSFMLTNVELAQTILGALTGALLTMTTITFSTIMVVLTTYSSQFSPRTLSDFVEDPVTMRVLGIFMGGFVYSVLSLLFMSENWYKGQVIAASVGVLIAFICLGVFAYFIQNVAVSIQVSTLIREITEGALKVIKNQEKTLESEYTNVIEDKKDADFNYSFVKNIKYNSFGFVQLTDYHGLLNYASKHEIGIEVNFLIGDFVTEDHVIFKVHHSGNLKGDIEADLKQYLKLGKERSPIQDPEFALQKLVEVALRAISPGINDPNTARVCISYLGMALSHLSRVRLNGQYIAYYDEEKVPRILRKQKRTKDILYLSFYQIAHYGSQDFSILTALVDAYLIIGRTADESLRKSIWELFTYTMEKFDHNELKELDHIYLSEKKKELSTVLGIAI